MSARAAGGKADDQTHRPRRIGLRPCDTRDGRQRGSTPLPDAEIGGGEVSWRLFLRTRAACEIAQASWRTAQRRKRDLPARVIVDAAISVKCYYLMISYQI